MGIENTLLEPLPLTAAAVGIGTAICGVLRCWIANFFAARHDVEATRRLTLLAAGVPASQRAAVIRACADLEQAVPTGGRCSCGSIVDGPVAPWPQATPWVRGGVCPVGTRPRPLVARRGR
jgi:hypothetical protein